MSHINDYIIESELGSGSFADVVLGIDKNTKTKFAIKMFLKREVERNKIMRRNLLNERKVLEICKHPNVVRLFTAFRDSQYFYFVLTYAPHGELFDIINFHQGLHINNTRVFAADLLNGVEYLHSMGIIHGDLKPQNILVGENMHLLISDFGTSIVIPSSNFISIQEKSYSLIRSMSLGTAEYTSPEQILTSKIGFKSDIWSIGCIIYQMYTGKMAFHGTTQYLTFEKIKQGVGLVSWPTNMDEQCRNIIESILSPFDQRPNIEELKSSPFFKGIEWDNLEGIDNTIIKDKEELLW